MSDFALPLLLLLGIAGCNAAPSASRPSDFPAVEAAEIAGAEGQEGGSSDSARQVIYRATLVLHVSDFSVAEPALNALIKATGGYVAQFRDDRPSGSPRGGRWTVRVPVAQFDRFVHEASKLGVTAQREVESEEVTAEFVDLEARLKNKQQLETRLLDLVAKRTDEVKDVIAVEAELARVREEVERMQGRLRYLTDRVAMTTVEITAFEWRDYRPPEATFFGRISQTFWQSLDLLRQFAEGWVLILVGLSPWLIVLSLMLGPFLWLVRRRMRKPSAMIQAV